MHKSKPTVSTNWGKGRVIYWVQIKTKSIKWYELTKYMDIKWRAGHKNDYYTSPDTQANTNQILGNVHSLDMSLEIMLLTTDIKQHIQVMKSKHWHIYIRKSLSRTDSTLVYMPSLSICHLIPWRVQERKKWRDEVPCSTMVNTALPPVTNIYTHYTCEMTSARGHSVKILLKPSHDCTGLNLHWEITYALRIATHPTSSAVNLHYVCRYQHSHLHTMWQLNFQIHNGNTLLTTAASSSRTAPWRMEHQPLIVKLVMWLCTQLHFMWQSVQCKYVTSESEAGACQKSHDVHYTSYSLMTKSQAWLLFRRTVASNWGSVKHEHTSQWQHRTNYVKTSSPE